MFYYKDYNYKISTNFKDVPNYGKMWLCNSPKICNTCEKSWNYNHELPYIDLAKKLLKNNSVGIDVGAHTGSYAIALKEKVKTIYSFEPNKYPYDALSKNSGIYSSIVPIPLSCGSTYTACPEIEVVSLDEFFDSNFITQFLKIDTDGYECEILKGSKNLIERSDPLVVIIELEAKLLKLQGKTPIDFFEALYNVGLNIESLFKKIEHLLKPNFFCNIFIYKNQGVSEATICSYYYN
jgi:hypothetical protein